MKVQRLPNDDEVLFARGCDVNCRLGDSHLFLSLFFNPRTTFQVKEKYTFRVDRATERGETSPNEADEEFGGFGKRTSATVENFDFETEIYGGATTIESRKARRIIF